MKHDPEVLDITSNGMLSGGLEKDLLANIGQTGHKDGLAGINASWDKQGLISIVRLVFTYTRIEIAAQSKSMRRLVEGYEMKVGKLKQKIESEFEQLPQQGGNVDFLNAIVYTFAGLVFIAGEYEFARMLLIQAFGLGQETLFQKLALLLSLSLAPVLGELIYARFIEEKYRAGAVKQPGIVRTFFFVTAFLAILFFGQLGFVRGVIFEYTTVQPEGDIYQVLYKDHPWLITAAFISMAVFFLIAGSVLLAVGFKHLNNLFHVLAKKRSRKRLRKQYLETSDELVQIYHDFHQVEEWNEFYSDEMSFNQVVEDEAEVSAHRYLQNYLHGKREALVRRNGDQRPDDQFHVVVQNALQQMTLNDLMVKEGGHHERC
ncbi:MAG: hypothetical protein IIA59_06735 [Candidatus Marinimicrobia bacterium]|nr:hypothetical protein [Candidatus Neomarinimicrobiota bacterium]